MIGKKFFKNLKKKCNDNEFDNSKNNSPMNR